MQDTVFGKSDNALPLTVDNNLAVFLGERSLLRARQNIENHFGRPGQTHALFRNDKGAIDQYRMSSQ